MWQTIQNLFSPSSLAALRNALTAVSVVIGALGIAGLTQIKLQALVDAIMTFGTAAAVLITAIAGLVAALMPIIASIKASMPSRTKSVAAALSAEANKPVAQQPVTVAMASAIGNRTDIKELNVASKALADAVPSDKVVAK